MSEPPLPTKAPLLVGDPTSQLVQVTVRDVGLKHFKAAGHGAQDIRRLVCLAYNAELTERVLWQMAKDFANALDAAGETVPDSFRAMVSAAILQARSNVELGKKQ